jgi:hypothetical protein
MAKFQDLLLLEQMQKILCINKHTVHFDVTQGDLLQGWGAAWRSNFKVRVFRFSLDELKLQRSFEFDGTSECIDITTIVTHTDKILVSVYMQDKAMFVHIDGSSQENPQILAQKYVTGFDNRMRTK